MAVLITHDDFDGCAAVINPAKNAASLRRRGDGVDLSVLAKALGGGGHPGAAGFRLPGTALIPEVLAMLRTAEAAARKEAAGNA